MSLFQYDLRLRTDPQVWQLADELGIRDVYLRGHLGDLWAWVFDHFKDGVIPGANAAVVIAQAAGWTGDPTFFVEKLLKMGFLAFVAGSEGYTLNGWKERSRAYNWLNSEASRKREQVAARVKAHRQRSKEYPRYPLRPPLIAREPRVLLRKSSKQNRGAGNEGK